MMAPINNNIESFLLNNEFVEYMLFHTEKQKQFWDDFLDSNPQYKDTFVKAEKEFKKIRVDDYPFPEKNEVYNRIIQDVNIYKKKKNKRITLFKYVSIASVVALIVASTLFLQKTYYNQLRLGEQKNIIGLALPEEDAYLLSNNQVISLSENSIVKASDDGVLSVKDKNQKEQIIYDTESSKINTLVVPYGKRSRVDLSDGTRIWVNSGSKLSFPVKFKKAAREIELTGEIYIEVAKSNHCPFIVKTKKMDILVYGTTFNVSAYSDEMDNSVVLVNGSVKIVTEADELILKPDEKAVLRDKYIDSYKVDVEEFISWKNGFLVFNKEPMSNVIKKIGRYYNISFSDNANFDFNNEKISGKLYLSNSIDSVMSSLSYMSPIKYMRNGNIITLQR
jgi:hypothetical protein